MHRIRAHSDHAQANTPAYLAPISEVGSIHIAPDLRTADEIVQRDATPPFAKAS